VTSGEEHRSRFVAALRREGVLSREGVAAAFAAVPRELFLSRGFYRADGARVEPDFDGFLDAVYANHALVTKLRDGVPVSSSSQPSLMAIMLGALDLSAGMRVLEIGAGTGYNAALMAAMGARVTSIDVQPDVVERARAALVEAGVSGVDVWLDDGYLGGSPAAPYDRVVVTVGVSGVSPHWLDQLAPGGFVVAPVAHAGHHPVLAVGPAADTVRATGVCPAGFMSAAGPLSARYPWAHPEPLRTTPLPTPTVRYPGRWDPPLDFDRYFDLWFATGAWDRRVTGASLLGSEFGGCVVLDEIGGGGAAILADGGVAASGERAELLGGEALRLVDRWAAHGRPAVAGWQAILALAGDPDQPVWVPRDWSLRAPSEHEPDRPPSPQWR
jgi:protein-L-isoaspartate(D-aspartate) O-methyltransferase